MLDDRLVGDDAAHDRQHGLGRVHHGGDVVDMLAMMGGQERTETEWRELLTDAGYAGITIRPTCTPFSVIEATPR
jgi:hypothetical protein